MTMWGMRRDEAGEENWSNQAGLLYSLLIGN